ncbi:FAD binding domain-containing protein, partial [Psychrobacter sp.]|uniref:FAD binding domain-containing protein n=1 Tax=Psychrobacter sp. TaxID=56811 RepID=UPI0025F58570
MIEFKLNNVDYSLNSINPNTTVLEFIRTVIGLIDVKEGCASGDCGACTVMVLDIKSSNIDSPFYTINTCITLLSLMHNQHLFTASYLADNPNHHPDKAILHPAQQALVNCHGSQCGFCTPGFTLSLACLYENWKQAKVLEDKPKGQYTGQATEHDKDEKTTITDEEIISAISGNLCRCTGYRPIVDAGKKMFELDPAKVIQTKLSKSFLIDSAEIKSSKLKSSEPIDNKDVENKFNNKDSYPYLISALDKDGNKLFIPHTQADLNHLVALYPNAILWAGGTDLGLNITQKFVDYTHIIQLSAVDKLKQWHLHIDADSPVNPKKHILIVGAGMTYQQLYPVLEQYLPSFAKIIKRIASTQIRNMATIGGNIANASPIGDLPPILLALDARVHIIHCRSKPNSVSKTHCSSNPDNTSDYIYSISTTENTETTEDFIPISEFFLSYKQTKLNPGSYIAAIHIPLLSDNQHLIILRLTHEVQYQMTGEKKT